jgi:hypothetical protein
MVIGACPPSCQLEPAPSPSLSQRIAETISLLARLRSLSPSELLTLAINLDIIADSLDEKADRDERAGLADV